MERCLNCPQETGWRWRCCPTKLLPHRLLAELPDVPSKRSPSLLFRKGEDLAGLSIRMLQAICKGVNTQFLGNFPKEGLSTLLFPIPGTNGAVIEFWPFPSRHKAVDELPPARLHSTTGVSSSESTTTTSSELFCFCPQPSCSHCLSPVHLLPCVHWQYPPSALHLPAMSRSEWCSG